MRNASQPVTLVAGELSGGRRAIALALVAARYRAFGTSRKTSGVGPTDDKMLVANVASVQQPLADVLASAGWIDLLVNNTGHALSGAAKETSIGQMGALFDTSFLGIIRKITVILPAVRAQAAGGL
jgi:NADP-dependent 3-hydroxy acid dehydrogenase YdfG